MLLEINYSRSGYNREMPGLLVVGTFHRHSLGFFGGGGIGQEETIGRKWFLRYPGCEPYRHYR